MRRNLLYVVVALFAAAAVGAILLSLGITGDSADTQQAIPIADNAPSYCQKLATLPKGIETAVSNAASGSPTDDDKKLIAGVVSQLREGAAADGVPADLKQAVERATQLLEKLSSYEPLTLEDAQNFAVTLQNMGEEVKKACSGN